MSGSRGRCAVGAVAFVAAAALLTGSAAAEPTGPEEFGTPSAEQITTSIRVWDPNGHVTSIETVSTDSEETVVSLDSDILFGFGRADLPATAVDRIAELVADIPDGIAVSVVGHTDDVGTDADNLDLSQRRADTVADVVAAARPDLDLEVDGRGESEPVASNREPEGRELNRRVEIRWTA